MTRQSTDDLPDTRPLTPMDAGTGPPAESEPDRDARPRAKLLDLSLTQLLGGSMAAATAAALGSRLGVVGTIAGAAVLSIVSAIAASLYTNSMARAKDAVVLVRSRSGGVAVVDQGWWKRPDRATTRRVLATTAAVFLIAAAFLAGLQLATGAQVTGTDLGGRAPGQVVDDARAGTGGTRESGSTASDAEPPVTSTETSTAPTPTTAGTPAPGATTPATGTDPTTDTPGAEATTAPEATPGADSVTTPAGGTSATTEAGGSGERQ
ncbi:hypothetical protein ACFQU3_02295 [Terrabacter sp. GCM10028922]|uniref:hypothetical protein n=1 Tax=Terrabacter sp. GCM10028922 TaxID=3273428 RepID=UPI00360A28C7